MYHGFWLGGRLSASIMDLAKHRSQRQYRPLLCKQILDRVEIVRHARKEDLVHIIQLETSWLNITDNLNSWDGRLSCSMSDTYLC